MRVRVGVLGVTTLTLFVLLAGAAAAHVDLVRVEVRPPTVSTAPPELVLEFSAPLDRAFSKVQVLDSQRRVAHPGLGTLDPNNPVLLRLPLNGVPPGDYQAAWRVRSQDGHVASGANPFTIAAQTPPSTPTTSRPTPTTTGANTATTTAPVTSTTTSTSPPRRLRRVAFRPPEPSRARREERARALAAGPGAVCRRPPCDGSATSARRSC